MKTIDSAGIIAPKLFDQYAAQWLAVVSDTDNALLQQSFRAPGDGGRLTYASFSVQQIVQLISAVGATTIKARFLIRQEEAGQPYFSLALFAADAKDRQLTSYYLAEPPTLSKSAMNGLQGQISTGLASYWQQNWVSLPEITAQQFTGVYGPLQGYTFELSDFMAPLAPCTEFEEGTLRVYFGLHEYYQPGPAGDERAQLLGLIVQLWDPKGRQEDALFFDVSKPCPPTC